MRSFLLATAAAVAMTFAPFVATAQNIYTPSTTATEQTQTQTPASSESTLSETESHSAHSQSVEQSSSMSAPDTSRYDDAASQPANSQAAPADAAPTQAADNTNDETQSASAQAYAQPASGLIDEAQLARDAGMSAAPIYARDVCLQRTVTLADHEGMTRSQKVEYAVDRASACRIQNVVISAPSGEAARLSREIARLGVPQEMISTERATSSEANVQMTFAGLATSSEQYAAMFNQQYAASAYGGTASDANPNYTPREGAPAASAPDVNTPEAQSDDSKTPETGASTAPATRQ